jgi:hypothetical protein
MQKVPKDKKGNECQGRLSNDSIKELNATIESGFPMNDQDQKNPQQNQQGGQNQTPGQQTQKPGQGGQQGGQSNKPGQQNPQK